VQGTRPHNGYFDLLLNPFSLTEASAINSDSSRFHDNRPDTDGLGPLDKEDLNRLHSLLASGIECNLKTLDVRSVGHRHHGLWYDLRSIMSSSLTLLAVVKSGNAAWIPGGAEALWGIHSGGDYSRDLSVPIGGKIAKVLAQFTFWASENSDLRDIKRY
jgi:hypothetical protein